MLVKIQHTHAVVAIVFPPFCISVCPVVPQFTFVDRMFRFVDFGLSDLTEKDF